MAGIDGRFDVVGDIWHALTRNLKYGEIISADISGPHPLGLVLLWTGMGCPVVVATW